MKDKTFFKFYLSLLFSRTRGGITGKTNKKKRYKKCPKKNTQGFRPARHSRTPLPYIHASSCLLCLYHQRYVPGDNRYSIHAMRPALGPTFELGTCLSTFPSSFLSLGVVVAQNFSEVTHRATNPINAVSALNATVAHQMKHLNVTLNTEMTALAHPGVPSFLLRDDDTADCLR